MDANEWKTRIKASSEAAGTYKSCFDDVIDTLALILQRRDETNKAFEESGGEICINHTNNGGTANLTKNPYLVLWNDLNNSALTYWRDLGLTPAGLKRIDENALKKQKRSSLSDAIAKLDRGK